MQFRHEWKHEINVSDMIAIRQRLSCVAGHDIHAADGIYTVRSLYFDNLADKALREKLDGVNKREKFRLRIYNNDDALIRLEKKSKLNSLCSKEQQSLSRQDTQALITGEWRLQLQTADSSIGQTAPPTQSSKSRTAPPADFLLGELYYKMCTQGLKPKTIVEYTREAFVYAPGNVRVTLDYNIRTGLTGTDFLNPDCILIPAGGSPIILEIKWDAYLPQIIRDAVQLDGRRAGAFSKYAACRVYG